MIIEMFALTLFQSSWKIILCRVKLLAKIIENFLYVSASGLFYLKPDVLII